MEENNFDKTGTILIACLFVALIIAGYISYKSIDFDILKKLEAQPLILPTPIITQSPLSTSSAE